MSLLSQVAPGCSHPFARHAMWQMFLVTQHLYENRLFDRVYSIRMLLLVRDACVFCGHQCGQTVLTTSRTWSYLTECNLRSLDYHYSLEQMILKRVVFCPASGHVSLFYLWAEFWMVYALRGVFVTWANSTCKSLSQFIWTSLEAVPETQHQEGTCFLDRERGSAWVISNRGFTFFFSLDVLIVDVCMMIVDGVFFFFSILWTTIPRNTNTASSLWHWQENSPKQCQGFTDKMSESTDEVPVDLF